MTIPLPLLPLAVLALLMAGATLGALALALCVAARDGEVGR